MKTFKHLTTLLLALVVFLGSTAQEADSPVTEIKKMPPHPRLLLMKGEERTLLQKIKKDAAWLSMHEAIVAESEKMIAQPLNERKLIGRRLLSVSRENLRRIFFLSYSFRMTNNKKFAQRAEQEMLKCASFSDWNPSHYLDVAEMTLAMAIGYDWCFNHLSTNSKQKIKEAIIAHGLKTSTQSRYNSWLKTENNWNQVCNAGITLGALALYEEDPTWMTQLVQRSVASLPKAMHEYAPDGAYPEGIGYWVYGTSFNVILLSTLERLYGSDFELSSMEGFMKTGHYSQHMITPTGNAFCYADNGSRVGFNSTVFWFYNKLKDPALLYMQKQALDNDKSKRYVNDRLLPVALIWGAGAEASLANPPIPDNLVWVGQGPSPVAVMRSAWEKPDAFFLGFKAGSPKTNHGHMDVGSFFFEVDGVKWSTDMGMQNYNQVEIVGVDLWNKSQESQRWDVFRYNNASHSTLTINDRRQKVDGYAKIDAVSGATTQMSATADITTLYLPWVKKAKRSVALVHRAFVVVEDKITTERTFTKVRWNMTTEADAMKEVGNGWFELQKGNKQMHLKVEVEGPIRPFFHKATPTNTFDSPNPGVYFFGFDTDLPRNKESTIRVYLMKDKTKEITTYKPIL